MLFAPISIPVTGKAYYSQDYIHVRWPWIILPVVVGVMSTVFPVFLVTTAVWCRKTTLWKTSLLPLLIGRLEVQLGRALSTVGSVDELSRKSKGVRVFLENDPGLSFVEDMSPRR